MLVAQVEQMLTAAADRVRRQTPKREGVCDGFSHYRDPRLL